MIVSMCVKQRDFANVQGMIVESDMVVQNDNDATYADDMSSHMLPDQYPCLLPLSNTTTLEGLTIDATEYDNDIAKITESVGVRVELIVKDYFFNKKLLLRNPDLEIDPLWVI